MPSPWRGTLIVGQPASTAILLASKISSLACNRDAEAVKFISSPPDMVSAVWLQTLPYKNKILFTPRDIISLLVPS